MAKLGVRTVDELVGRTDLLKVKKMLTANAAKWIFHSILNNPYAARRR